MSYVLCYVFILSVTVTVLFQNEDCGICASLVECTNRRILSGAPSCAAHRLTDHLPYCTLHTITHYNTL